MTVSSKEFTVDCFPVWTWGEKVPSWELASIGPWHKKWLFVETIIMVTFMSRALACLCSTNKDRNCPRTVVLLLVPVLLDLQPSENASRMQEGLWALRNRHTAVASRWHKSFFLPGTIHPFVLNDPDEGSTRPSIPPILASCPRVALSIQQQILNKSLIEIVPNPVPWVSVALCWKETGFRLSLHLLRPCSLIVLKSLPTYVKFGWSPNSQLWDPDPPASDFFPPPGAG